MPGIDTSAFVFSSWIMRASSPALVTASTESASLGPTPLTPMSVWKRRRSLSSGNP